MTLNTKPCLVACSVLKPEIGRLIENGKLDAEVVYVSKYFHVDYSTLEKNLRKVIEHTLQRSPRKVILVYGNLCLGMKGQMNKLAEEYGIVKIDALNCIDCQLGGKGKSLEFNPNQDLFFLTPGFVDFFRNAKNIMRKEGFEKIPLKELFKDMRGFFVLDTMGTSSELIEEINKLETGLEILGTKYVGCNHVKTVIQEAIKTKQKLNNEPS